MPKTDSTASVYFVCFKISKTAWRTSVVESIEATETSVICNSVEIWHVHAMFRKVAFLEISRSFLLAGVVDLQCTVYNSTKNELLTKFLKGALKFTENFGEVISNGVPYQKVTDLQTTAFSLACLWNSLL